MINFSDLNGRRLAMIAWGETADGEKAVAVFSGVASWDGGVLTMRRQPETASFVVPAEFHTRIRPVAAHLKATLLDAEYCFSVSVSNLGEDDDPAGFISTGLKWPRPDEAG